MKMFRIRYSEYGSRIEKIENNVASDLNIGQLLVALADKLELHDHTRYKLVLERSSKSLRLLDIYSTLLNEGVQDNDKLLFILHENTPDSVLLDEEAQFLVTYTLTLKVPNISFYPQYSIYLNRRCENSPKENYFNNPKINGRLKFENFFKEKVSKSISYTEINQLIELWCQDICQGHQTTTLSI
jgi:hypothetical protein